MHTHTHKPVTTLLNSAETIHILLVCAFIILHWSGLAQAKG